MSWRNSHLRCWICSHEWRGVYHVGCTALECPECSAMTPTAIAEQREPADDDDHGDEWKTQE